MSTPTFYPVRIGSRRTLWSAYWDKPAAYPSMPSETREELVETFSLHGCATGWSDAKQIQNNLNASGTATSQGEWLCECNALSALYDLALEARKEREHLILLW